MTTSDSDDRAARKARADAIRRARDRRKASLAAPADAPPQKPSSDPPRLRRSELRRFHRPQDASERMRSVGDQAGASKDQQVAERRGRQQIRLARADRKQRRRVQQACGRRRHGSSLVGGRHLRHIAPHMLDRVREASLRRILAKQEDEVFREARAVRSATHAGDAPSHLPIQRYVTCHDGILVVSPQLLCGAGQRNTPRVPRRCTLWRGARTGPPAASRMRAAIEAGACGWLSACGPHNRVAASPRRARVAPRQSRQTSDPAERLGMTGVSLFTVDEDRVESVQLAVFAEQTLAIQIAR